MVLVGGLSHSVKERETCYRDYMKRERERKEEKKKHRKTNRLISSQLPSVPGISAEVPDM